MRSVTPARSTERRWSYFAASKIWLLVFIVVTDDILTFEIRSWQNMHAFQLIDTEELRIVDDALLGPASASVALGALCFW